MAVLGALAFALVLVVDGSVAGRETAGPTGLGPELDELFERCWPSTDAKDTCFEPSHLDGEPDFESVPGARAAGDDICRSLIPLDTERLAGFHANWIVREEGRRMLACGSPTRVLTIGVFRGFGQLRCVDGDATRRCTELADGSQVKTLTRPDDSKFTQIVRAWDGGDALMIDVGPVPPGEREPDRAAVVEALSAGTAIAFDLGR